MSSRLSLWLVFATKQGWWECFAGWASRVCSSCRFLRGHRCNAADRMTMGTSKEALLVSLYRCLQFWCRSKFVRFSLRLVPLKWIACNSKNHIVLPRAVWVWVCRVIAFDFCISWCISCRHCSYFPFLFLRVLSLIVSIFQNGMKLGDCVKSHPSLIIHSNIAWTLFLFYVTCHLAFFWSWIHRSFLLSNSQFVR